MKELDEVHELLDGTLPELNEQLSGQGLYMKSGAVSIDASVIEAKQRCPKKGKDGQNTQASEASWNVQDGSDGKRQSSYGYKAYANVWIHQGDRLQYW